MSRTNKKYIYTLLIILQTNVNFVISTSPANRKGETQGFRKGELRGKRNLQSAPGTPQIEELQPTRQDDPKPDLGDPATDVEL